ncbi:MAG: C-terminal helicase domain-containing protein, partial [Actinomycetota bacterium]
QARGGRGQELEVLAAITKLRRFCCHPRLVYPDVEVGSSKVEALITLVEELRENGHRALVFSQFVDLLDLVRERLDECGISFAYLDGSTPRATRQRQVDAFQAGESTLFLISLKAGGFGLNLTGAGYVIHLDPWWNPAVEDQATDRAWRLGQTRKVNVHKLVCEGTVEEKVSQVIDEKRALAEQVVGTGENADAWLSELSTDELRDLIVLETD